MIVFDVFSFPPSLYLGYIISQYLINLIVCPLNTNTKLTL